MSNDPDPKREPDTPAPRGGFFRRNWDSIRICLLFGLFLGGLWALRWWGPVDQNVIQPFTHFVAFVSEKILDVLGFETTRDGIKVTMSDLSLEIMEECNGVPALLIYLAAVLAHSAGFSQKVLGVLIGVPAIFIVNEVRIISLFFARKYLSFGAFEMLHVYVWQTIIIIFSLLLWLYWAERVVRRAGPKAPAA